MSTASSSQPTGPALRVTLSQRLHSPAVGYADQIVGTDVPGIAYSSFSGIPSGANADVVHLHRLKSLGGARVNSGLKRIAAAAWLAARVKRHRLGLVRTLHGPDAPGARGRAAWVANTILNLAASEFVVMDTSVRHPKRGHTTVIPFGHYRERFVGYPRASQVSGRMLHMGLPLRHSAEVLAKAAVAADQADTVLRVVGSASRDRATALETLAAQAPDFLEVRIEALSDGALVQEITAAEGVVLASVTEFEDLHAIFLALSLDRPVLVPETALTRSLASQVGEGWITLYAKRDSAQTYAAGVTTLRGAARNERPHLDGRDPVTTSSAYADVFRAAASRSRGH